PRVHRVLVSTVSDQAVRGTNQLLRQLAHRAPAAGPSDPACTVLVTQFESYGHQEILAGVVERLRPAALDVSRPTHAAESSEEPESTLVELDAVRSEEHTSELQSRANLVCRLLPEKK